MAKTVLIVEDNELNMKLFRDLLEAHGYQTSGTSNHRLCHEGRRRTHPRRRLRGVFVQTYFGRQVH